MQANSMIGEDARLASLYEFDLLDTAPDEAFDRITRLAMDLLKVPVAKINLIDRERQWSKSSVGEDRAEMRREDSFCTWTISQDEPLVIRDAKTEPRFCTLPQVKLPPYFRFYAGVPLRDRRGNNLGALCCQDFEPRSPTDGQISALQHLTRLTVDMMELRKIATIDDLTRVMTKRAFLDSATRDVGLSLHYRRPLSAVMIDLDHFKAINDLHGHAAGDHLLSQTATLLSEQLRASDYIGRIGGEKFAVILRETPATNAVEIAERLRLALASASFSHGRTELKITASLGVAGLEQTISNVHSLLRRADASLDAAKAGGRNRTMMLTPEPFFRPC